MRRQNFAGNLHLDYYNIRDCVTYICNDLLQLVSADGVWGADDRVARWVVAAPLSISYCYFLVRFKEQDYIV